MAETIKNPQNHNPAPTLERLNAVRLIIVLIIAFGYASTMRYGPGTQEMLNVFGYDPSWIGIQLLFFVSGLLAYRSIEAGRTGLTYLRSRFWRNIPILAILTLATLLILFPLFGTPPDQGLAFWSRLAKYVALTVFCIDPGIPIEGLMDDARYMCLVQGGIWTLRYGLILHVLTAISGRIGLLSIRPLLLVGTVGTTLLYVIMTYWAVKSDLTSLTTPLAGVRLSYAFLLGMTVWAYRDMFQRLGTSVIFIPLISFGLAAFNYFALSWTPLIEVALSVSWMSVAWIVLTHRSVFFTALKNCPNLTLPVLLINWPLTQTLLLINPDISAPRLIAYSLSGTLVLSLIFVLSRTNAISLFRRGRSAHSEPSGQLSP